MKRQNGQSALEFALMAPIVLLIVFGAIYGGAMFIQFLNYNNEARTIAREVAVANSTDRAEKLTKYNGRAVGALAIYDVSLTTVLLKRNDAGEYVPADATDADADEVFVRFDFDHGHEFPFGFPPRHFAASYRMQLENH